MRRLLCLLCLPLLGQTPHFTVREAIQAEWARQPLAWTDAQKAALPPADRARLERTLLRIGAPGTPALLPPELEKPTLEVWEAKARSARSPQERFTALFMLNRLKSPQALTALDSLAAADAATWPKHLHLEASLAAARLNGADISQALQAFLDARQKAGKVDPVRAQAARLRLVMAGKEKELLPLVPATPGSVLALMDAWNRAPWERRRAAHMDLLLYQTDSCAPETFNVEEYTSRTRPLGMAPANAKAWGRVRISLNHRLLDGLAAAPDDSIRFEEVDELDQIWTTTDGPSGQAEKTRPTKVTSLVYASALQKFEMPRSAEEATALASYDWVRWPPLDAALLPTLRKLAPQSADSFRAALLRQKDATARAAAIEDLPAAPTDLAALTQRTWADKQFEAQQTLIQSYARWKMSSDEQKAQLRPWLQHPDWACRWEAYQALAKLDPATPWPAAPKPTKTDAAILKEAMRLAERGKLVRLRIAFSGKRSVTLRLDPTVAPMNVANLVLLAKKGYFNGRLVPRVVPDFVVQVGSPYDTMDGGPGYTVRCENSLTWYGPGSVGMALSGKDTGGSQFFITTNATPHLTGKYTRMGEVEDLDRAMKVLDDLELGAKIESIKVLEP